jgi:hypothetical protein
LLTTVDIVMLQEKMTVEKVLVVLLREVKRTLPRNILSLGGQVVLDEWLKSVR